MNEINTDSDLVIKPLKGARGKPHDLLKNGTVKAVVYLGRAHDGYSYPVLSLVVNKPYYSGCEERDDKTMLHIKFNASTKSAQYWACRDMYKNSEEHDLQFNKDRARGFLRGPMTSPISAPYGGDIEARYDNQAYLACGLGLLERARKAVSDDETLRRKLYGKPEILRLIVGLRLIGVTIVIKNAKTDKIVRANPQYSLTA